MQLRFIRQATTVLATAAVALALHAPIASAQQTTDSTARSRTRVTSQQRIPVRKSGGRTTTASTGSVVDSAAILAERARQDSIANAERMRADSLAALERARMDSLAAIERARQDSIALAERMRADSIARADSLARIAAMRKLPRDLYFSLNAGGVIPRGFMKDAFDPGYNLGASLGWHPVDKPIGLRVDGNYSKFTGRTFEQNTGAEREIEDANVISGLAQVTIKVPRMLGLSPYLVGGGGVYHFSNYAIRAGTAVAGEDESSTKGGWNAGAGIDFNFGRTALFLESRYTRVPTQDEESSWIPVVLGITFR